MGLQHVEEKLDELLVKKAPYQLPESAKENLVKYLPWVTLIGGVLALLAAIPLYQALTLADRVMTNVNAFYQAAGYGATPLQGVGVIAWLSLLLLVLEGLLFFMAFTGLKEHKKSGWNILYWVALLNLGNLVIMFVANWQFGSFLFSLVGEVIGFYLLFQIRSFYGGAKTAPAKPSTGAQSTPPTSPTPTTTPPKE